MIRQMRKSLKKLLIPLICIPIIFTCAKADEETDAVKQLENIRQNEELRVGIKRNTPPLTYFSEESGNYKGIEPAIAMLIAKEIGPDVEVSFLDITPLNRNKILDTNYIDCLIASYSITEERKKRYDFSSPYFSSIDTILVNSDSDIKKLEDLKGKKIGFIRKTNSAFELVRELIREKIIDADEDLSEKDFYDEAFSSYVNFMEFNTYEEAVSSLTENKVDGVCLDKTLLRNYMTDSQKLVDFEFGVQQYGIVTPKGSDLSPFIDSLIRKWQDDGTLQSIIRENTEVSYER